MEVKIEHQVLQNQIEKITNFPRAIESYSAFGAFVPNTNQRTVDALVIELNNVLKKLNFASDSNKEEENKIAAFAAFVACTARFYDALYEIASGKRNTRYEQKASECFNPFTNKEKYNDFFAIILQREISGVCDNYFMELDGVSRQFNSTAHMQMTILYGLVVGLSWGFLGSLPFSPLLLVLFTGSAVVPIVFGILGGVFCLCFLVGLGLSVMDSGVVHSTQTAAIEAQKEGRPEKMFCGYYPSFLPKTFGFFQEAAAKSAGMTADIRDGATVSQFRVMPNKNL